MWIFFFFFFWRARFMNWHYVTSHSRFHSSLFLRPWFRPAQCHQRRCYQWRDRRKMNRVEKLSPKGAYILQGFRLKVPTLIWTPRWLFPVYPHLLLCRQIWYIHDDSTKYGALQRLRKGVEVIPFLSLLSAGCCGRTPEFVDGEKNSQPAWGTSERD